MQEGKQLECLLQNTRVLDVRISFFWQLMRNLFRCESDQDPNEKINHLLVFEGLKAESGQDAKV